MVPKHNLTKQGVLFLFLVSILLLSLNFVSAFEEGDCNGIVNETLKGEITVSSKINSGDISTNCNLKDSYGEQVEGNYKIIWKKGAVSLFPNSANWGPGIHEPFDGYACQSKRGLFYSYSGGTAPWPENTMFSTQSEAEIYYTGQEVSFYHTGGPIKTGIVEFTGFDDNNGEITLALVEVKCLCGDKDSDGYNDAVCGGDDCNDNDANINPGATETCDEVDNNCNGQVDEDFDFENNINNCGGCGIICSENEICNATLCVLPPDLSIGSSIGDSSIRPIQIIEEVYLDEIIKNKKPVVREIAFVENKPAMVRVKVDLENAEIIENVEVKLTLFEYVEPSSWPLPTGTRKIWEETKTQDIKLDYIRMERKLGDDTVNFFPSAGENRWLPQAGKKYYFEVEVDPDNKIKESNELNNKNMKFVVVGKQSLKKVNKNDDVFDVLYVPVAVGSWRNATLMAEEFNIAWRKQHEFLSQIYPLGNIRSDWKMGPLVNPEIGNDKKNLKTILKGLSNLKKGHPEIDRVVGIVPAGWMNIGNEGRRGISYSGIKDAAIVAYSKYLTVAAHEIWHTLGDWGKEEYKEYPPFGLLSEDGWCLNQDTGESCGARINVNKNQTNHPEVGEDVIDIENKFIGYYYFCFMGNPGNTVFPKENLQWVDKEHYKDLLNKFVKFK